MSDKSSNPLPPGWKKGFSNSQQKVYYFHEKTKHTQWHFPTASEAADPVMAKKRAETAAQREESKKQPGGGEKRPGSGDTNPNKRPRIGSGGSSASAAAKSAPVDDFLGLIDATSVAIIVPFRDLHAAQNRAKHLKAFIPHMVQFLSKQKKDGLVSDFHIYIMEQSDDGRKFNRGKLLNIGFDMAKKSKRGHDVFIFHDGKYSTASRRRIIFVLVIMIKPVQCCRSLLDQMLSLGEYRFL